MATTAESTVSIPTPIQTSPPSRNVHQPTRVSKETRTAANREAGIAWVMGAKAALAHERAPLDPDTPEPTVNSFVWPWWMIAVVVLILLVILLILWKRWRDRRRKRREERSQGWQ